MLSLGIDPSASERRRTGLALLDGSLSAGTWTAKTDEEILQAARDTGPDIIAFDSPLSLPRGRCCADPSCPCAAHGIVREADRAVARMGYHPYWTLLPSMAPLTLRSMGLKERMEAMGLRVIEVYPGAAQDRLGLPRKKAGVDALERGLGEIGVRFEDRRRGRTHDELDAVTAAYVGLCYLRGEYEAAGPPDEVQIILPPRPLAGPPWSDSR